MNRRLLGTVAASTVALAIVLLVISCASKTDNNKPGTATPTAVPGSSTPAPRDAYLMYHDDHNDIIVRDLASGATYTHVPVDITSEVIVQTRCSDDGTRIAYLDQVFADAAHRRIIIRGANAPADPVTVPAQTQWIAWSPDGTRLAVVLWDSKDKKATLGILDVNSGDLSTIMEGDQYIGNIAWSPAGDRIAFYLENTANTSSDIYTIDATGQNLVQLTHGNDEVTWLDPSWSPDGSTILSAGVESNTIQLYNIDPNSGDSRPLTSTTDIYKRNPYYSPDGSIIAYTGSVVLQGVAVSADALHQFAIFTINPDGSDDKALTADPRGTTPGPNDPYLNAYMLGWCAAGPWLDDLWTETTP